jgi:4-hydroxy-2-oxoglutarate aldolase
LCVEYALNKIHGYGVAPRKPLLPLKEKEGEEFMGALSELLELEAGLEKEAQGRQ